MVGTYCNAAMSCIDPIPRDLQKSCDSFNNRWFKVTSLSWVFSKTDYFITNAHRLRIYPNKIRSKYLGIRSHTKVGLNEGAAGGSDDAATEAGGGSFDETINLLISEHQRCLSSSFLTHVRRSSRPPRIRNNIISKK